MLKRIHSYPKKNEEIPLNAEEAFEAVESLLLLYPRSLHFQSSTASNHIYNGVHTTKLNASDSGLTYLKGNTRFKTFEYIYEEQSN